MTTRPSSPSALMASLLSLLLLSSTMTTVVNAHVELLFPPPINSKYDPQTIEANIDYSMTSPLEQDGSNFPCKGYNTPQAYSSLKPVATLTPGKGFEIEFAPGGAVHGGGSCQFSISYDQGKTFAVIYSVEGGCPLQSNYTVPIPSGLPSAKSATFSWTWFNKVGNREMYQNCAIVDIATSSTSPASFTGPQLYRANTFKDGSCSTVEGVEPVFPNPGSAVEYGGTTTKSSKVTKLDNCALKQDGQVTVSPDPKLNGGTTGGSTSSSSAPASSTTVSPATKTTQSPNTPVQSSTSTETSSSTTETGTTLPTPVLHKRPTFKDRTAAVLPSSTTLSSGTNGPSPSSSASSPSSLVWSLVPTITRSLTPSASPTSSPATPASETSTSSASATSLQAAVTPYVQRRKTTTRAPIRTPVRVTTTLTRTSFATATTTTTSTATATSTATLTVTSSACSTAAEAANPTTTGSSSPFTEETGPSNESTTYLQCDTLVTFSLCEGAGVCTFMGSVAPGTQCRDGKIVLATATRLIKVRRGQVVGVPLRGDNLLAASGRATGKTTMSPSNVGGGGESNPETNQDRRKKRGLIHHETRRHS